MTRSARPQKRTRGEIVRLPSGSLRVKVYAGIDPISNRRHYLTEVVADGPKADKKAEKVRTKLLNQVDEQRQVRTSATVGQLLDRYFELLDVDEKTLDGYDSAARHHIRPLIGDLALNKVDGEILDSFYKELRTCRAHCRGTKYTEHRTDRVHDCDDRCGPHKCRPLASTSIHKIHAVLSGAGKRGVRWGWLSTNPFTLAEPLPMVRPDPQPPSAEQAATIATEAWKDIDWGMLVWLAMTTGARRGELCALKWEEVDFDTGVVTIRSSIAQRGGRTWEKDTKTHQQRRIALDQPTLDLLCGYRRHCGERAGLGVEMPAAARVLPATVNGTAWLKPDSVSQRYARMCARLGWDMNIHQLRHYSATELIAAGTDVRTVAGRLGHGGGGTTTLKVYSAWVAEADQRAAGTLGGRLPKPAVRFGEDGTTTTHAGDPSTAHESPYQRIAADLRGAIVSGAVPVGEKLPAIVELAARYNVSSGTAQRAVAELRSAGLVTVSRGQRAVVADPAAGLTGGESNVVALRKPK